MGRPLGGPAPPGDGGGIIIFPPGDGQVPPPVIPPSVPERGQNVVSIEARTVDISFLEESTFNRGGILRVDALFTLNWDFMLHTVRSVQISDPNLVTFPPNVRRALQQPDSTDGSPVRFDIPANGPVGTWTIEISAFLEIDRQIAYAIALPVTLSFFVI